MQSLTAAGQRKRGEAHAGDELAYFVRHLAQLSERDAFPWVQVENHTCGEPGRLLGSFLSGPGADESPLRHVHFQRRLLRNPCEPLGAVDDRIRGGARLVSDRTPLEPVRGRRGELLLEERGLVDTVGPALACHRPARDVRHHRLGHVDVVVEDLGLGGPRRRVQHLVRIGQLHPTELIHHTKVLPGVASDYEENLCGVPACGRSHRLIGAAGRRRP